MPQIDRKTRRKIRQTKRKIRRTKRKVKVAKKIVRRKVAKMEKRLST